MASIERIAKKFGFVLSDIFSRYCEISTINIKNFIGVESNLQELILKICKIFPKCDSAKSINEIQVILNRELKSEVIELSGNIYVDFFLDFHQIHCFFSVLQNYSEDIGKNDNFWELQENSIGYFQQLKCVEFCRTFKDIKRFVLKDSNIEEYFDFESEDYQLVYQFAMKKYYEKYYKKSNINENFRAIVLEEIKIFILDTFLSHSLKENKELAFDQKICGFIPEIDGSDQLIIDQIIRKLKKIRDYSEFEDIFELNSNDVYEGLRVKRIQMLNLSFSSFGDLSTIYSYLQLRELQIKEILYYSDKILNNEPID